MRKEKTLIKKPYIMKYEYVTSDKLKKSLKKKTKEQFENQIRVMASGISYMYKFHKRDDKDTIIESAIQNALSESSNYKDDGESAFTHFSNIIKRGIQSRSSKQKTKMSEEKIGKHVRVSYDESEDDFVISWKDEDGGIYLITIQNGDHDMMVSFASKKFSKSWNEFIELNKRNSKDKEICSDEELKSIATDWCNLVGQDPDNDDVISAFTMGAKLAISNNGWTYLNKDKDE